MVKAKAWQGSNEGIEDVVAAKASQGSDEGIEDVVMKDADAGLMLPQSSDIFKWWTDSLQKELVYPSTPAKMGRKFRRFN